jgi:hypothetical protein
MNPKDSATRTEVGPHNTIGVAMEDLPEAVRRYASKYGNEVGPHNITMATATPTVTPNLIPEELVKFVDVAVASKYRNDLTNFTCTITEEVCSTLDTFKTDLQNMLPRQIRLVV